METNFDPKQDSLDVLGKLKNMFQASINKETAFYFKQSQRTHVLNFSQAVNSAFGECFLFLERKKKEKIIFPEHYDLGLTIIGTFKQDPSVFFTQAEWKELCKKIGPTFKRKQVTAGSCKTEYRNYQAHEKDYSTDIDRYDNTLQPDNRPNRTKPKFPKKYIYYDSLREAMEMQELLHIGGIPDNNIEITQRKPTSKNPRPYKLVITKIEFLYFTNLPGHFKELNRVYDAVPPLNKSKRTIKGKTYTISRTEYNPKTNILEVELI